MPDDLAMALVPTPGETYRHWLLRAMQLHQWKHGCDAYPCDPMRHLIRQMVAADRTTTLEEKLGQGVQEDASG